MVKGTARDRRAAAKQFLAFASIEADPNASSVTWLQARLADMVRTLHSQGPLSVYEPTTGTFLSINSPEELSAWANRNFPVAHFNL